MHGAGEPGSGERLDFLSEGGEMGRLMREHDWSSSVIGPPRTWPQSLRTATSMCLNSRFPMFFWWGPQLAVLYNDGYIPILGDKHPQSLGAPGREVWSEIWDVIGPMLDGVMKEGRATWSEDQLLLMNRAGFPEETYFTFSYSPIIDETGGVGGVFCAVSETTPNVLAQRRLRVLTEIADRSGQHREPADVARAAVAALDDDRADIPFALLYECVDGSARLVAATGVTPGSRAALRTLAPGAAHGLDAVVGELPGGPVRIEVPPGVEQDPSGSVPVAGALVAGLDASTAARSWRLVIGVPARLALDRDLTRFYELVANAIATALSAAIALEFETARAAALAELDRAKTDFFTNISHEFRTPLTLLLGPLEEELARRAAAGEDAAGLEIAHRNAMRLLRLVNALLDFSRAEAGRTHPEVRPTDLSALTAQLASTFASAVQEAGLDLELDLDGLTRPVLVDPDLWERILLNLLSNALKHTFEGSIAVRGSERDGWAVVEVADTGIGIPVEHRERIFERFYRVPAAASRSHEGSGIGLALVAELARAQGGRALVEPGAGGVGTRFVIELPLSGDEAAQPAAPSPLAAAHIQEMRRWRRATDRHGRRTAGRPRILVVDDNADMRDYLRELLEDDVDPEVAVDGADALERLRADPSGFDLILTDVMMPRLDGLGLLTAVREDAALAEIPVVVLSARAGPDAAVGALELGADDYVVKPFTASELRARVRSTLELARSRTVETRLQREHASRMEDLYTREHRVAEALQRSLLPATLPAEPHLAIAGSYVASEDVAVVGGDWYDAVVLDDGSLVVTIGDVAGHGLSAAAVMGQLRSATRGYALRGDDPATMLSSLNALVAGMDGSPMVTCQVVRIDAARERLHIACAGHPPAVLVPAAGDAPRLVASPGPPLGVTRTAAWQTGEEPLGDGAVLVLYTDGLVERRTESLDVGLERLRAGVASLRDRAPEELAGELLSRMRPADGFSDDVAVLVTGLGPVDASSLDIDFPADPRSLATLRRALRRWLAANEVDRAVVYDVVLAVDEAASNAIEHAYGAMDGTVSVRAARQGQRLRFSVDDDGRWRASREDDRGRGIGMIRRLMDDVQVITGDDGTRVELVRSLAAQGADA